MNPTHYTSLSRVPASVLRFGDVFKLRTSQDVYEVVCRTGKLVHAVCRSTERSIRLSHSNDSAPDYVYRFSQAAVTPKRFDGRSAESRFMIAN